MRHRRARAERDFIDVIDGRQSARVKFAKDHALGRSFNTAKSQAIVKALAAPHQTLVARTDRRESISQNDPIGRCLIEFALPLLSLELHTRGAASGHLSLSEMRRRHCAFA